MRILSDVKLGFDSVAIVPKRSSINSRSQVYLVRNFKTPISDQELEVVPIIVSNLDTTGVFNVAIEVAKHKMMTALHKFYSEEQLIEFANNNPLLVHNNVFYTLGMREGDLEKFRKVRAKAKYRYRCVMIDVPNGYIKKFYEYVKRFREEFPEVILGAGNVVTCEAAQDLILDCGVEFLKIGLASGNLCNSYRKTGVYYPQLSACIECADVAHGLGAFIISDGGIKQTGDFSKVFCANGDMAMAGSFFCGVNECDGEWIEDEYLDIDAYRRRISSGIISAGCEGLPHKTNKFNKRLRSYGMSSSIAIDKYYSGEGLKSHRTSEGLVKEIPAKGPVSDLCWDIIGGLKSTGSYIGAKSIRDFGKCCSFIKI